MDQEPLDAFKIRGFVRPLTTTTDTVDVWIGADLFVSLRNLLRGQIGRPLLCEYFHIDLEKLNDWVTEGGSEMQRTKYSKDFYRRSGHIVRCACNGIEVVVSEDDLSKTMAGKHIILAEEGREDHGIEGCLVCR